MTTALAVWCPPGVALGQNSPTLLEEAPLDEAGRMDRIEDQLRALSERNLTLEQSYNSLSRQYDRLLQQLGLPPSSAQAPAAAEPGGEIGTIAPPEGFLGGLSQYTRRTSEVPRRDPEQLMDDYMAGRGPYLRDMAPERYGGSVFFQDGLQFRSSDGYFSFMFHNLTQVDGRIFDPTGDPLSDNIDIPRQRWYFQGDTSPYASYYTSLQRGFGTIDVLDAWIDLNLFPRRKVAFQIRVGRMKTPYSYEYIKMADSDLMAPERSLFITNFAPNRQDGLMIHGQVLNLTLDYALGVFNGPRRSFDDTTTNKSLFGYLNFKPFLHWGIDWLEQLNVGASLNGGDTHNVSQPTVLQTAVDQTASAPQLNASPTFLVLNSKTIEDGARLQWAADTAYYYKSFTLLGGYYGATQDYALSSTAASTTTAALGSTLASGSFAGLAGLHRMRVPIEGWTIACTYFLTGEQITRRVYLVEPVRPFGYYNGRFNPGAIEIYSRFSDLQLGHQIFTGGFADPNLWTNRANTVDTGVNWYLNHYIRLDFDWQHCMWGSLVYLSPTQKTRFEEFYWFRAQVFF